MENELEHDASSLEIEPQSIDYGCLTSGQEVTAELNVSGGPGKVSVGCDQVIISPTSFDQGEHTLKITLLGGRSGELICDEITLTTDAQELKVPVTARWANIIVQTPSSENIESATPHPSEKVQNSGEHRTFIGKSCALCGKNFCYYSNSGTWEQCNCNVAQKTINITRRIIIDLRMGAKEIPSYLEETWRLILGKERI